MQNVGFLMMRLKLIKLLLHAEKFIFLFANTEDPGSTLFAYINIIQFFLEILQT